MFWEILLFLVLFMVCFIPILWWGYLFTYYDDGEFNRKRFLLWIFAWIISVYPVLYLWDFIDKYSLSFLNPFFYAYSLDTFWQYIYLFWSFLLIIFVLIFLPFLLFNIKNYKTKWLFFLKKYLIFSLFSGIIIVLFSILEKFFNIFPWINIDINSWVYFLEIWFNSLKLVIFYYTLVALFEELSKFFNFSNSKYFEIKNVRQWVLYSMFVALWFGFIENILYLKNLYESSWWVNSGVIWVFISRNIFSVFLHVLCSSIFAYFYSKAYLSFREDNISFLKISFIWFIFSVVLHSIFNVFLTLQITFIVFLYLIFWYFYLTYIFYTDENLEN